jgi:uncharacterized membrane protein YjgN (DUF898 family)
VLPMPAPWRAPDSAVDLHPEPGPLSPSPASAQQAVGASTHGFEFRGSGSEYFRIWIVNLLLSIITLGIYSAWAAIRRRRYFLGNTYLDGHSFDYHAAPMPILIGRLIVVAVFIAYNALIYISPVLQLVGLVLFFVFPWLINAGLRFNAAMTSYRTVRFGFGGTYWGALVAYGLLPLVGIVSLGLLLPFASHAQQRYLADNTRWGNGAFAFEGGVGGFYGNMFASILFALVAMIALMMVSIPLSELISHLVNTDWLPEDIPEDQRPLIVAMVFGVYFTFIPMMIVFSMFYQAGVRNLGFSGTTFDKRHTLISAVSRLAYVGILFSNLLLTVLTLGLFRPWASVRTWSYLCRKTGIHARGQLDTIMESGQRTGSAGASQYLDFSGGVGI